MADVKPFELHGTALVTGASSGLGLHYAEFLARSGMRVILVARSVETLEANAAQLRERHQADVEVIPTDLSDDAARQGLIDRLATTQIDVLINNAGFGTAGQFAAIEPERMTQEIDLNITALTQLTRAFLPGMLARRHGAIINVASTAAFQPIPTMAVYAATKAYVLSLTQALWSETRETGVRVLAICPGPTETNFFVNTGEPNSMRRGRRTPEQVVQTTFRALNKDLPSVIDGGPNAAAARLARLTPMRALLPIARKFVEPR